MGRGRSGARVRNLAAACALAAAAGCASVEAPRTSTIRELTIAPDAARGCTPMRWPVDGALSSPFGRRDGRSHDGIDIAVPEETPVHAACDGIVAYAGNRLRGYGNLVILRHADGLATVYAHNRTLLVHEGEQDARGQVIARSGQTGHATAPHVHFEVRKDSIARDPLGYLRPRPLPQAWGRRRKRR
jgi:murein DD-endopeptidase MepM/ murein hydrolase activator NlpD